MSVAGLFLLGLSLSCIGAENVLAPDATEGMNHHERGFSMGYEKGFTMGFQHTQQLADDGNPAAFLELSDAIEQGFVTSFLETASFMAPKFDELSDPDLLDMTLSHPKPHHRHSGRHHLHGSRPEPELDLEDAFLSDLTHNTPEAAGTRPAAPRVMRRETTAKKPQAAPAAPAHALQQPTKRIPLKSAPQVPTTVKAQVSAKQDPEGESQEVEGTPDNSTAADEQNETQRKIEEQERRIKELEERYEHTQNRVDRYEQQQAAMSPSTGGTDSNGKTEFIKGYEGGFKVGYEAGWNMATADLKKRYGIPKAEEAKQNNAPNVTGYGGNNTGTGRTADVANSVTSNALQPGGNTEQNQEVPNEEEEQQAGMFSGNKMNNMFRGMRNSDDEPRSTFPNPFKNGNPFKPENNPFMREGNPFFSNNNNNNNNNVQTVDVQPPQQFFNQPQQLPEQQQQQQQPMMPQQMQQFVDMQQSQPQQAPDFQNMMGNMQGNMNMQQPQQNFANNMQNFGNNMQQMQMPNFQNGNGFDLSNLQGMFNNNNMQPSQVNLKPNTFSGKAMSFLNNIKGMIQEGKNTVNAVRDALRPDQVNGGFGQALAQQQAAPQLPSQGTQQLPFFQNLMQTQAETPSAPAPAQNTGGDLLSTLAGLLNGGNQQQQPQQQQQASHDQDMGLTNLAQLLATTNPSTANPAAPKPVSGSSDSATLGMQEMQNMINEGQNPV